MNVLPVRRCRADRNGEKQKAIITCVKKNVEIYQRYLAVSRVNLRLTNNDTLERCSVKRKHSRATAFYLSGRLSSSVLLSNQKVMERSRVGK